MGWKTAGLRWVGGVEKSMVTVGYIWARQGGVEDIWFGWSGWECISWGGTSESPHVMRPRVTFCPLL